MDLSSPFTHNQTFIFPTQSPSFQKSSKYSAISCKATTLEAPTQVSTKNLYKILSLESEKVGFDDIKKAYRNMARQYHPDVVPVSRKEESTKMFVEVQKAYETLSNPVSRQKYDFELGCLSRCGVTGTRRVEQVHEFSKEVWNDQLSGLEMKSKQRKGRGNMSYV